jgi:hypothetical protein
MSTVRRNPRNSTLRRLDRDSAAVSCTTRWTVSAERSAVHHHGHGIQAGALRACNSCGGHGIQRSHRLSPARIVGPATWPLSGA